MNAFSIWAVLGLDSSEYDKNLEESKGKASGIGSALSSAAKIGAAAITAATGAVTAFAGSAVRVGEAFDASMSQVAAVSGAVGEDFDALRAKAQEMGATTKFSASEAADAMNYMAMAGWKSEQMISGIEGIMNLAAAAGEDLATTSDIVTDALTAFGLAASDSGRFADVLAAASSNANTNVSMLGESFKYVAPVAGSLGYSAEDTSIALGLMANSGIKASQAGTALRTTLTNLAKPTDTMQQAMDLLHVSLTNDEGEMKSLLEVMGDLRKGFRGGSISADEYQEKLAALDSQYAAGEMDREAYSRFLGELKMQYEGASEAQKAEVAAMLAGKEGMSGLLAIVNASDEDFQKLTNSIYESEGAAAKMSATMQDNLAGDITIAKSALEGLQIAISDELTPSLRDFVQFGSKGLSRLTEAFGEGGLGGAVDAFGEILSDGLAMIVSKLPKFVQMGMQLLGALGEGIIANLPVMADSALSIIMMLADSLIGSIPQMIPAVVDIVLAIADKLTDAETLTKLMDAALQIVVGIGSGLIAALPKLVEKAPVMIGNFLDAIRAQFPNIVLAGAQLIAQMLQGIGSMVAPLLQRVGDFMRGVVDAAKQKAQEFFSIGKNIVDGVWNGIKAKKEQFTQQVRNFFSGIVNGVKSFLGIHSPSTVFAGIGENMALGLGVGFDRDIAAVGKDMQGAVANITNGFDTASISYDASGAAKSAQAANYGASGSDLVAALQSALDGMGVYIGEKYVGKMVTDYQRNMTRRGAMA